MIRPMPFVLFWCFLAAASPAYASGDVSLDTDYRLFNERDLAPGDSVGRELVVRNRNKESADVFVSVDDLRGNRLAGVLGFVLRDKDGGNILVGAPGDERTLRDLHGGRGVFVERIRGRSSRTYEITLTFDRDAGNRYQDLSTTFDIGFRLTGVPARSGSQPPYREHQYRGGSSEWDSSSEDDDDGSLRHALAMHVSGAYQWCYRRAGDAFTHFSNVLKYRQNV